MVVESYTELTQYNRPSSGSSLTAHLHPLLRDHSLLRGGGEGELLTQRVQERKTSATVCDTDVRRG